MTKISVKYLVGFVLHYFVLAVTKTIYWHSSCLNREWIVSFCAYKYLSIAYIYLPWFSLFFYHTVHSPPYKQSKLNCHFVSFQEGSLRRHNSIQLKTSLHYQHKYWKHFLLIEWRVLYIWCILTYIGQSVAHDEHQVLSYKQRLIFWHFICFQFC